MNELTMMASVANLPKAQVFMNAVLKEGGCPPRARMQLNIAFEEMFVNVAHYAYFPKQGDITIRCEILPEPRCVQITLIDGGVPYDPLAKDDPDITLSVEKRKVGGLGIFMVKKSMDEVEYRYEDGKNIFTMRKFF